MKYWLIIFSMFFFSCNKSGSEFPFNSIKVKTCETDKISDNQIKICLQKIENDSRCPLHAICVHRGFATGTFSIKIGEGLTDTIKLDLKTFESVNPSEIELNGYKIIFNTLNPYPGEPGYSSSTLYAGMIVEKL